MNKNKPEKMRKKLERKLRRSSKNAAFKRCQQVCELPFGRKPGGCHKSANIYTRKQKHSQSDSVCGFFVEMGGFAHGCMSPRNYLR